MLKPKFYLKDMKNFPTTAIELKDWAQRKILLRAVREEAKHNRVYTVRGEVEYRGVMWGQLHEVNSGLFIMTIPLSALTPIPPCPKCGNRLKLK